jgi:hypothetical protein
VQVGAALAASGAAVFVLATVRNGFIDAGDAVLLIAALAALTRSAIRLASGPDEVLKGVEQDPERTAAWR